MENKGHVGITGRLCDINFMRTQYLLTNIKKRNGRTGSGAAPTWTYFGTMDQWPQIQHK